MYAAYRTDKEIYDKETAMLTILVKKFLNVFIDRLKLMFTLLPT